MEEKLYIGHTNNLQRRFLQHNDSAKKSWTSKRGPWKLLHSEIYTNRAGAMNKETYLKTFKNKARIQEYIAGSRKNVSYKRDLQVAI